MTDKMTVKQRILRKAREGISELSRLSAQGSPLFVPHVWRMEFTENDLLALSAALSAPRVPAGWIIRRGKDGAIVVQNHGIGGYAAREMGESGIAESILYHLAEAMLDASPEPVSKGDQK